jgi:hypothetical protein
VGLKTKAALRIALPKINTGSKYLCMDDALNT